MYTHERIIVYVLKLSLILTNLFTCTLLSLSSACSVVKLKVGLQLVLFVK